VVAGLAQGVKRLTLWWAQDSDGPGSSSSRPDLPISRPGVLVPAFGWRAIRPPGRLVHGRGQRSRHCESCRSPPSPILILRQPGRRLVRFAAAPRVGRSDSFPLSGLLRGAPVGQRSRTPVTLRHKRTYVRGMSLAAPGISSGGRDLEDALVRRNISWSGALKEIPHTYVHSARARGNLRLFRLRPAFVSTRAGTATSRSAAALTRLRLAATFTNASLS
jgi:hypothetical protein